MGEEAVRDAETESVFRLSPRRDAPRMILPFQLWSPPSSRLSRGSVNPTAGCLRPKGILTAVAFLCTGLSLLPASSYACSADEDGPAELFPPLEPDRVRVLPRSAALGWHGEAEGLDSATSHFEFNPLWGPDGLRVSWAMDESPTVGNLVLLQPEDGWLVGDYRLAGQVVISIIDEVDEQPPDIEVLSWEGLGSDPPALAACGGPTGPEFGARLFLEPSDELVHHEWFTLRGRSVVASGLAGARSLRDELDVGALGATPATIRIEGTDLSGNQTVVVVESVQGCAGCSSHILRTTQHSSAGIALLLFLTLHRRRHRRQVVFGAAPMRGPLCGKVVAL